MVIGVSLLTVGFFWFWISANSSLISCYTYYSYYKYYSYYTYYYNIGLHTWRTYQPSWGPICFNQFRCASRARILTNPSRFFTPCKFVTFSRLNFICSYFHGSARFMLMSYFTKICGLLSGGPWSIGNLSRNALCKLAGLSDGSRFPVVQIKETDRM